MQYLLLIYGNEAGMKSATEADRNAMFKAYGELTANIIKSGGSVLAQSLQMLPIINGTQAAEFVLMQDTLLANHDTTTLMRHFGEDRVKAAEGVKTNIKNPDIVRYLTEGSFASQKDSAILNWLGDIYPPAEELRKASVLFVEAVGSYEHEVNSFPSADVNSALDDLNRLQAELKDVVANWQRDADKTGVQVVLDPEDARVFPTGGFRHPLIDKPVIDPDVPIPTDDPVVAPAAE